MMDRNIILGKLSPFGNRRNLIKNNQQVPDIISAMLKAHEIYAPEYDKIALDFYTGDPITTAKKIFNFLKQNIQYKVDSEKNQQIMSPSGILAIGKNDCKNFALFIVGILDSLKRKGIIKNDVFYRFASYRMFDEMPHHVFAVIKDQDGNEIFVDPVLNSFNERKTYYHKIDKRPKMAIYSISGFDESQIGLFKKKQKAAAFTTSAPATTSSPAPAKKPKKKIVLKIALAPARGAFLLLVGLNFLGLATKLKASFTNAAGKTESWWKNLGGNPNELLRKVNQGATKKRILGDDYLFMSEGQIGVAPAAGAAAATAAPILIKVAEFLKSLGLDPKEIAETGKEILAKKIKSAVDKNLSKEEMEQEISDQQVNEAVDQAMTKDSGTKNMLPIIIGGGVIAYLLFNKK